MNIEKLENQIRNCKKCHGIGVVAVHTDAGVVLEDCDCVKKMSDIMLLVDANIPSQYWDYSLKNLTSRFVNKNKSQIAKVEAYIDNLDSQIKKGRGIWFNSAPGLGKSIIIVSILRESIKKGFTAYFERASHIVNLKFRALKDKEASDLVDYIIKSVNILAIEEIEKVYLSDDEAMNNQLFYEFLSDVYDAKISLLISSNDTKVNVLSRFPGYIKDRLKTLANITFVGAS